MSGSRHLSAPRLASGLVALGLFLASVPAASAASKVRQGGRTGVGIGSGTLANGLSLKPTPLMSW